VLAGGFDYNRPGGNQSSDKVASPTVGKRAVVACRFTVMPRFLHIRAHHKTEISSRELVGRPRNERPDFTATTPTGKTPLTICLRDCE
jgi:hypothetical protein